MSEHDAAVSPLVVSMGDPAGIGPEIIWRAWQRRDASVGAWCVLGHAPSMRRAAGFLGIDVEHSLRVVQPPQWHEALQQSDLSDSRLLLLALDESDDVPPVGQLSATAGRLAARSIECAAGLCLAGRVAGLVTAPIHKQALAMAGWDVPGHTEMLQQLAAQHMGVPISALPVRMMLANPELQTVLHSIHVSLRDALDAIQPDALYETLAVTAQHVQPVGDASDGPRKRLRIAVAGVNPHAGEGGRFGREEIDVIAPVVALARAQGWDISGPWAPDTVFMRARAGEFDVVVAMYHDQGLIPVKYLGVDHGVNVTLGLPFVRTSPDHGTAMDVAGQGQAREHSLHAALMDARRRVCRASNASNVPS